MEGARCHFKASSLTGSSDRCCARRPWGTCRLWPKRKRKKEYIIQYIRASWAHTKLVSIEYLSSWTSSALASTSQFSAATVGYRPDPHYGFLKLPLKDSMTISMTSMTIIRSTLKKHRLPSSCLSAGQVNFPWLGTHGLTGADTEFWTPLEGRPTECWPCAAWDHQLSQICFDFQQLFSGAQFASRVWHFSFKTFPFGIGCGIGFVCKKFGIKKLRFWNTWKNIARGATDPGYWV